MSVPLIIPQAARNMFQEGMEHVAQQLQSRFKTMASVKSGCTGKSAAFRKAGKVEMTDMHGRILPTVGQELLLEHRYVFPRKASLATILDEDDAADLDLGVAPTGEIREQHQAAVGRKVDDIFLAGIMGTNLEGVEDSMASIALPATQFVPVNFQTGGGTASLGLTLAKLIRAKGKFGKAEVYGQEQKLAGAKLCMAVSQDELDNLLRDVEQTGNSRYSDIKALVEGEIDYFMGINFIRTERLPTVAAGVLVPTMASTVAIAANKIGRTVPMWVTTGVKLAFWYDVKTNIDTLPAQSQAIQVYSRLKVGACRMDEDRVVGIWCEQDA